MPSKISRLGFELGVFSDSASYMALINCHECGNQVSDNAVACPKCGAPVIVRIQRAQKAYLIRSGISFVFVVIMLFFVWLTMHNFLQKVLAPLKHQ